MIKRFLSLLMAFALIMSLTSCWWKAKKVASVDTEKAAESDIEAENISTGTVESESETVINEISNNTSYAANSEISNTESETPKIENETVKSDSDIVGGEGGVIGSETVKTVLKAAKRKVSVVNDQNKTETKKAAVDDGSLSSLINNATPVTSYSSDTTVEEMSTVKFGSYPQSDESGKTKDPIEWIVLDKQDGKALLLSKYILDNKSYHYRKEGEEEVRDITWKDCFLREWLNTTFMKEAFSKVEQDSIQTINLINNDNAKYNISGGENTEDKIFCLSIDEINKYFGPAEKFNKKLGTKGTNFAKNADNLVNEVKLTVSKAEQQWYGGNSFWYLRSPGESQKECATVQPTGRMNENGNPANHCDFGVRPALWVGAKSLQAEIIEEDSLTLVQDGKYELMGMDTVAQPQITKLSVSQQKEVDEVIAEFKKKYIKNNMTDFEKEMMIIQYLVATNTYDLENYIKFLSEKQNSDTYKPNVDAFSAYGALVKNKSVCQGYAEAFYMLCKACGLESEIVSGHTRIYGGGSHAWNKIKLDGEWYLVDVTWEDPTPCGWYMYDPPIWEQNIQHNGYGWGNLSNTWINRTANDFPDHYNAQYNKPGNTQQVQYEVLNENGEIGFTIDFTHYLDESCTATKYGPEAVAEYLKTGKVKTK